MEQAKGIEPSFSAWKADVLAVVRCLHGAVRKCRSPCPCGHNWFSGPFCGPPQFTRHIISRLSEMPTCLFLLFSDNLIPLTSNRFIARFLWCLRALSGRRRAALRAAALPSELQRHKWSIGAEFNRLTRALQARARSTGVLCKWCR